MPFNQTTKNKIQFVINGIQTTQGKPRQSSLHLHPQSPSSSPKTIYDFSPSSSFQKLTNLCIKNNGRLPTLTPSNPIRPLAHPEHYVLRSVLIFFSPGSYRYSWLICLLILKSIYQNYNILLMSIKSTSLQHPLILLLLACLVVPSLGFFCSSQCVDYSGACWNETTAGCIACAHNIFNIGADWTSPTPCTLLPQRTVVANELPNSPAMSLAGYSSTQVSPVTCSNYTFSGQYTSADTLFKNFTNIGLNHYQIIVRFNVGYIGTWSESDYLRVTLGDSVQIVNYDYYYSCGNGTRYIFDNVTNITTITDYTENINGEVGYNSSDCVRIKEYTLTHNTSYLTVEFSALTTEANPAVQFWGIKELFVVTKDCHSYCLTCYGGLSTQCLSCASGYYLQGNVCLQQCDPNSYIVLDTRVCVNECPLRYYANVDTATNIKQCLACSSGCRVCSSSSVCLVWDGQEAYVPDMWKDKMQFWILLIIILCSLVGLAIYKLMTKRAKDSELQENMMSKSDDKDEEGKEKKVEDGSVNKITNTNESFSIPNESIVDPYGPTLDLKGGDNLWFNELVEMEPVEVKVRGRKRRVKDIDPLSMNGLDAPSTNNL